MVCGAAGRGEAFADGVGVGGGFDEDVFADPEGEGLVEEGGVHGEHGLELGEGAGDGFVVVVVVGGFGGALFGCGCMGRWWWLCLSFRGQGLKGVDEADLPRCEVVEILSAVFKGEGDGGVAERVHPAELTHALDLFESGFVFLLEAFDFCRDAECVVAQQRPEEGGQDLGIEGWAGGWLGGWCGRVKLGC